MKSERGDDDLVDLNTARREEIPLKNGKPVAPATPWRWRKKGIDGVKLKVVFAGSTPVTCRRWINEFFEAIAASKSAKRLAEDAPVSDSELREAGLQ